jgi:hypothetical protein
MGPPVAHRRAIAWVDPFVVKHPHLRIKRRADGPAAEHREHPGSRDRADQEGRLAHADHARALQIWASADNYRTSR